MRRLALFFLMVCSVWPLSVSAKETAAPAKHILFLLTSNGELFGTGKKTGSWLDTLSTPYYLFTDAGDEVTLASVKGGEPPIDPASEAHPTASDRRFHGDPEAVRRFADTLPAARVKPGEYDALFLPDGHGMLWDFVGDGGVKTIVQYFVDHHKLIIAIGHSPAALLDAVGHGGNYVAGHRMTAFTKEEETVLGLQTALPVLPDRALDYLGATVTRAAPFAPHVERDEQLITGQNPASAAPAARLALQILHGRG